MMTSVATVAGHFPLTLVTGAGAAARNSIGLVLVGGMTIGTIFTLFIVPSLYMLIAKEHHEKSVADVEEEPEETGAYAGVSPWHATGTATAGSKHNLPPCISCLTKLTSSWRFGHVSPHE